MSSSRTTDAAEEDQAAGPETEDAVATSEEEADELAETESEAETDESSESEPEGETDSDDAPDDTTDTTDDSDDGAATTDDSDEGAGGEPAETARSGGSGVVAGAVAIVSAGLGIASLTGTWLSDLMASRQELIGQINGQTSPPDQQIEQIFGSPWHTTALFNGFFALAAIIAAVAALLTPALAGTREASPTWVRAVAFGGLALGVIGLVIAGVMWFDLFTDLPAVPEPTIPQPGVQG